MRKQRVEILFILGFLIGLLSGCGGRSSEPVAASPLEGEAAGTENMIDISVSKESAYFDVDFYELSDSSLRDFSKTEDGYLAVLEGSEILQVNQVFSVESREVHESTVEDAHRLFVYREIGGAIYTVEDSWSGDKGYVSKDGQLWLEINDWLSCELEQDAAGNVFLCSGGSLYCNGAELALPKQNAGGEFYRAAALFSKGDAILAVLQRMTPGGEATDCSGNYLCALDGEHAVSLGTELPVAEPVTAACSDGDAVYLLGGDTVYRLLDETLNVYAELLPLGAVGADTLRMLVTEDGGLILAQSGGLSVLRKHTAEEAAPAETRPLRLAASEYVAEYISEAVASYNRLGAGYRIEVETFPGDGDTMGLAIASGEQYDLICESDIGRMQSYAKKEILAPLDDVEALQSEELFQNILDVYRIDGSLYYFSPAFSVGCVRIPEKLLDDGELTVEWLLEIMEEENLYRYSWKENELVKQLWTDGTDQWTESGFLDENFQTMLEFCNRFTDVDRTEQVPYTEISMPVDRIVMIGQCTNLDEMRDYEQSCQYFYDCGMTCVSNPFSAYTGASVVAGEIGYVGVCSRADVEGSQSFLEYLVSAQYYKTAPSGLMNSALPLRRSSCDFQDGDIASEKLLELIEGADHLGGYSDALYTIILEETGPYFSGECTSEECASRIRSRYNIYLAEHG